MKTLEKKIICYTSRKSSVLRTDAHSKLGSEAAKKSFQKNSYKKRRRRKPNTCLKKRGARRKFSNGQHVENIQIISQHSSSTGQGVSNLSTNELACAFYKGNSETAAGTIKLHKRKRRKRKRKVVDHDEASRLQRRTRYLLIKMKLEQNLIDAYSGDGWNGHRREKLKPEKELQRAQKQIVKCKLGIRDAIHQLDSLSCVGSIADSLMHPDGSVFHEYIFCAKCRSSEAFLDNDIILCDGTCNRGFHQKCLEPPLEKIPPGDQAWLCKFCTCKLEILETINAHLGTCFSVNSSWEDIFMEATTCDVENACLDPAQEWPSDDSEDEDYNPEKNDNSNSRSGIEENMSDDSGSLSSLFSDGAISYSDLEHYEEPFLVISRSKNKADDLLDSMDNFDSGQSNECEITSYRRQRKDVDYKKLHDEMFGKEPPENESQTEDEDWGPNKRKRRRVEASSIGTCMADSVNEDTCSNLALPEKISSDRKKQLFRIPPDAVEKLRLAFAENELPSRSVKENLSKQLGIASEKVGKWFKNARYAALKTRKNETISAVKNQCSSVSMTESLSQVRKSLKHLRGQRRLARQRKFNKGGTDHDARNESEQLYLAELERLCRLEDKLQNLKKALLLCSDEEKLIAETYVREQNLIYVPVVEIKEKA